MNVKNSGLPGQGFAQPKNESRVFPTRNFERVKFDLPEMGALKMRNSITVQNSRMPLVEYQGQRVVTFAMVDEAHQRPKGTARAAFNRNRDRFIPGRHFYEPSPDVIRTMMQQGVFPRKTARGVLITEMGYLLLVKPFSDDLSWLIQEELVNAYFRQPEKVTFQHIKLPTLNELAAMSLEEAQHAVAQAEHSSKVFHGSQGSAGLHMRKSELKTLRPAMQLVDAMGQIGFRGNDWEAGHE